MTIIDILTKVRKSEQLTAEEKSFLEAYDHQKELDGTASAARKKAEADATKAAQDLATAQQQLKDAQAKLEEADGKGKSDTQKLAEQVAALTKQVQDGVAEKAKLVRQAKLDDVVRSAGLQFVPDVDGGIMRSALVKEFEGLPDDALANAEKVKPIIDTFRARNKAVILDTSGHGAGGPAHNPGSGAEDRATTIEKMTPEQRQEDLKKRGII